MEVGEEGKKKNPTEVAAERWMMAHVYGTVHGSRRASGGGREAK